MSKPLYYKDTRVSPNSALYAALVDSRNSNLPKPQREAAKTRAEAIYQECEREYIRWTKPSVK